MAILDRIFGRRKIDAKEIDAKETRLSGLIRKLRQVDDLIKKSDEILETGKISKENEKNLHEHIKEFSIVLVAITKELDSIIYGMNMSEKDKTFFSDDIIEPFCQLVRFYIEIIKKAVEKKVFPAIQGDKDLLAIVHEIHCHRDVLVLSLSEIKDFIDENNFEKYKKPIRSLIYDVDMLFKNEEEEIKNLSRVIGSIKEELKNVNIHNPRIGITPQRQKELEDKLAYLQDHRN